MTDHVARLRGDTFTVAPDGTGRYIECLEAADHIEKLEAEVARLSPRPWQRPWQTWVVDVTPEESAS